jgi:hypothetical protein
VAVFGYANLALIVDGSYRPPVGREHERRPGHSYGGAGLVLVRLTGKMTKIRKSEVIANRACGFTASSSSEAEFQAVIRGARWAPGVTIYTDCRSTAEYLGHRELCVRYLNLAGGKWRTHDLAHLLSVQGQCRDAPSDGGAAIAKATRNIGRSDRQRRMGGVDILLEKARNDPAFDGDFVALAERLGWTSGRWWRDNPLLVIAAGRWEQERAAETTVSVPCTGFPSEPA